MLNKRIIQESTIFLNLSRRILRAFILLMVSFVFFSNSGFSQNSGFILLKSNPSGADVIINGKNTGGETPFQMQLEAGTYKYLLQYDMYNALEGEFTIIKGQTITKEHVLKPAYGNIIIVSEPSGADIRLDGVAVNQKTPATLVKIRSGQHSITLSKEMYSDHVERVTVNDEITSDVFIELQAKYGTIGIVTSSDASITIDGNKAGSGNYFGRLSSGRHEIMISRENYYPQSRIINIKEGQEEKMNFVLKPIIGSLSVMVDPPETGIYLNKTFYGTSPKIIDSLIIGKYELELVKEGFASYRQRIMIEENKTFQINSSLPEGKLIRVNSTPDGAEIFYNGSSKGITPTEFVVNGELNKLLLTKKYYTNKEVVIKAERNDQSFNFNLDIDRTKYNVKIETKPTMALAYLVEKPFLSQSSLYNTYAGTPNTFNAPLGKYDIKIEKKGYKLIEKEIILEKDEYFSFNLEPMKYRKKGTSLILSSLWPGAGQSYLKRGSPTFLMGILYYGSIGCSFYQYSLASKNYDEYLDEIDPQKRSSLKTEYQNNLDISKFTLYAGAAIWSLNFIWTLATKSEYKRYRNVQFSLLNSSNASSIGLAMHYDF